MAEEKRALTEEEHHARAMLMGMCYHHGNGAPVYFRVGDDGIPETLSFIDAETLEPLAARMNGQTHMLGPRGITAHNAIWNDWGRGEKFRPRR
jgi:hypothetical protein